MKSLLKLTLRDLLWLTVVVILCRFLHINHAIHFRTLVDWSEGHHAYAST